MASFDNEHAGLLSITRQVTNEQVKVAALRAVPHEGLDASVALLRSKLHAMIKRLSVACHI